MRDLKLDFEDFKLGSMEKILKLEFRDFKNEVGSGRFMVRFLKKKI